MISPTEFLALKTEITSKGVEVRETDLLEFIAELSKRGAQFNTHAETLGAGFYVDTSLYPSGDWDGFSQYIIAISAVAPNNEKYLALMHEYGHHICRNGGCSCSNPDFFHPLAEAHVHRFVIERVKVIDLELLTKYVDQIAHLANFFLSQPNHDARLLGLLITLLIYSTRRIAQLDSLASVVDLGDRIGDKEDKIRLYASEELERCNYERGNAVNDFLDALVPRARK